MHTDEYTFIYIHTLTYKYCYPYLKCSITVCPYILPRWLNTLRSRQYGRPYTDDIFKWIFLIRMYGFRLKSHWNLILVGTINIIPAQAMLWRRPGDKPLSELMMVRLLTHICTARPQWVKYTLLIMDDNRNENISDCMLTIWKGILKHWNSLDKMAGAVTGHLFVEFSSMKACMIFKFCRSFLLRVTINYKTALVKIVAWLRSGDKPSSRSTLS